MYNILRFRTAGCYSTPLFCPQLSCSQRSQPRRPSAPTWGTCISSQGEDPIFLSLAILIHVQCGLEALPHRQSLTNQCLSPSCLTVGYPISLTRLPRGRQLISVFPQCPGRTGTQEHLLQNLSQQNPVHSTCSPTPPIAHLASPSPLLEDKTGQTLGCRGVGWEAERAQSEW